MIIFKVLQNEFFTEYKMYDLESMAIALVFPLVSNSFVILWKIKQFIVVGLRCSSSHVLLTGVSEEFTLGLSL